MDITEFARYCYCVIAVSFTVMLTKYCATKVDDPAELVWGYLSGLTIIVLIILTKEKD